MSKNKFDLTQALKRQILSSTKLMIAGGATVALMTYDSRYGTFTSLRFGDLVWGGTAGLLVSLIWDGTISLANGLAEGLRVQSDGTATLPRPYSRPTQPLPAVPQVAAAKAEPGGRMVTINNRNGSRKLALSGGGFEHSPTFISRETWGETLKRLLGRQQTVTWQRTRPAVRVEEAEFCFWSYDHNGQWVQLMESHVKRFLSIAWRNREQGQGLSERRWGHKGRHHWPTWYQGLGAEWYWAMMRLLEDAEKVGGIQLVINYGHQWKRLKYDNHMTLGYLRQAERVRGLDIG